VGASTARWSWLQELQAVVLSLLTALTLCGLILLYLGESPLDIYFLLLKSSLGTAQQLSTTLRVTIPYLLCGLALAVSFQAGLFNIGAEGQMLFGALVAGLVGALWKPTGVFAPFWVLMVATLAGMFWALIPAILKIRFQVHEVINTIMLNYIAAYLAAWVVVQPAYRVNASMTRTPDIPSQAQLHPLTLFGIQWEWGLFLGFLLALLWWHVFQKTRFGYEVKATGKQPEAARTAGISVPFVLVSTFLISGGLAGLAGGLYVTSPAHPYFEPGFSPGWGFWGIALALLARNHPLGVCLAALLFGVLETGSSALETQRAVPRELVQILEALIILLLSSRLFPRLLQAQEEG
jgi:simple sugar transport system permease protein